MKDENNDYPENPSAPTEVALSRELATQAQHEVRRDVIAANQASSANALVTTPAREAGVRVPTIITGDGQPARMPPILGRAQPRSRQMRVALIGLAGCVVLLFLFAATPLTAGATNRISNLIAGSNLLNYPTATPTITPIPDPYSGPGIGYDPGKQTVINDIKAVFGPKYSLGALGVAHCESGFDPNAWNKISILGSHAEGVFQILFPSTWLGTAYARQSPYNYDANIHAAYQIFSRDGFTWREWECQP